MVEVDAQGEGESSPVSKEAVSHCVTFLRHRLCGGITQPLRHLTLLPDADRYRRDLQDLLSHTIVDACNNSALLLGPRGCGKSMVLERVLADLQIQYPDQFLVVRLSGFLHSDDHSALKDIARQLCAENQLMFSNTASFEENLQFLMAILRDLSLSHKAVIFALEEFDIFAQRSKQSLLYNLLDSMQSDSSQIAVIGMSSRLDADQLLEKRVRSRFSNRKFLFLPPLPKDLIRLLEEILSLPTEQSSGFAAYALYFNCNTRKLLEQGSMKELLNQFFEVTLSPQSMMDLAFRAICNLNRDTGLLSEANFRMASAALRRKPKLESLKDLSVLELYLLVAMKRLEGKEREVYNFNTAFKEYEQLSTMHSTSDSYSRQVSLRAFEHLIERELIAFTDRTTTIEFRAVKLLVSSHELKEGLLANPGCPTILHQWFEHETFK